jgi:hypothetical protein
LQRVPGNPLLPDARGAQIARGTSKARKRALLLAMIDDPSLCAGIEADLAEFDR